MRTAIFACFLVFAVFPGCALAGHNPVCPNSRGYSSLQYQRSDSGKVGDGLVCWGYYNIEIARDGSCISVARNRTASTAWGYHLNAVKLLESSPCTNCLNTSNVHKLPDGNLSIDISITHPYDNPVYTGFDVRGIIMFRASQEFPDNGLRVEAGLDTWDSTWRHWISRSEKGDAELVNAEGWTVAWAPHPSSEDFLYFEIDSGFPIFRYYPGKYAPDDTEKMGTINPFIRFWSNSNRHMFEAGQTVTRTYIIKPPASGPIEACYAVYAHWVEPSKIPVEDPATDFPPEANSPMPYEFWVTQDQVIDPDAPPEESAKYVHWHIKTWSIGVEFWGATILDLLFEQFPGCDTSELGSHPCGQPDDYTVGMFCTNGYAKVPNAFPGKWPYLFIWKARNPNEPPWWPFPIGSEVYIADIDIGPMDGQW